MSENMIENIRNNKQKILIVDDERFYINLLIELLSEDYETVVAKNGTQALALAQDKPDLILLDIMMPDMDGYSVCQQLKENLSTQEIPIIFLTIKSDLEAEIRGFKLGAVDYISKPISPAILQARVATHLDLSHSHKLLADRNKALESEHLLKDEQLRRSEKMAALGKLTGGIAHDFNNILGIILGYTELLQSKLNNSLLDNYVKQILDAVIRGKTTTQKLLAFSHLEASHPEEVNINDLLKDDFSMLEKTLTVNIKLKLELNNTPCLVWLDKNDLQDAILNMCINAMHAMPQGGSLTLSTLFHTLTADDASNLGVPAADYVQLNIKDTGCGMDKSTKEQVFDPFFTTKNEQGTGLGMSQVYGLVQRSSGAIQVDSTVNQGTCISLYFPCYIPSQKNADSEEDAVSSEKNDYSGNESILIIDDEDALREMLEETVRHYGYKVFSAASPGAALDILQTDSVDLVISDVIMPEMNGYRLASIIHEKYPDIKIQILSGFGEDDKQDLRNNGLYANRIQKPVNSKKLLKRIRTLLDT